MVSVVTFFISNFIDLGPLLFLWWVWLKVFQFCLSVQRTSFWFHWYFLLFSSLFISALIFMISFLLLPLGLVCCLSSCFRCKIRLFIWDFSCFLKLAYITVRLHLRTAFAAPHRFWIVTFSFVSRYFLISSLISSVIHWLFSSILFSLHMFVLFMVSSCSLLLTS